MARVKKITFVSTEWDALKRRAGGETQEVLAAFLRGATHVGDLVVRAVTGGDVQTVVYVESDSFPVNPCCWLEKADEWTAFTLGEQRG